jgi:AcrR family transcriptional regulator
LPIIPNHYARIPDPSYSGETPVFSNPEDLISTIVKGGIAMQVITLGKKLIPYYFRSKEGLYLAVIDYIIDYYLKGVGEHLAKIKRALNDKRTTQAEYRALFDDYMRTVIHFVLQESKERSRMSHINIREQLDPTSAFDRLYEGFVRDLYETMSALIGHIIGPSLPPSELKLITHTVFGQIPRILLPGFPVPKST